MGRDTSRRVLIVSSSARALARSARQAGWRPLVLDLFADQDTCALAAACRRIPAAANGFSAAALRSAAKALDPREVTPLVYGGGLESLPETIEALTTNRPLLGNSAAVVARVKEPSRLAELLVELSIPHPEIRRREPEASGAWLQKEVGGSGGLHVFPAGSQCPKPGVKTYFQQRVSGRILGVTFLASGEGVRIVGFAEQLLHDADPRRPFVYGGALALETEHLPVGLRRSVAAALRALVGATGLRGLCGVDLVQDGDRWWLIDVNPRPGASFELHERDHGCFGAHVDAVQGRAARLDSPAAGPRCGLRIVYARASLRVPLGIEWPDWVSDRPWPGTFAESGEPVCTVRATARNSAIVRTLLEKRYQRMMDRLEQWQEHQLGKL